jgi:predicted histone-like DNA-binding protein
MGLVYKIMPTFTPGRNEKMWFPKLTGSRLMNLRDVAKQLAKESTLSEADVYAEIFGLINLIPDKLLDWYTVKLDGFGSFRLHAKVETSDDPSKIDVRSIKELRISFKPDNEIKKSLKKATISKSKKE